MMLQQRAFKPGILLWLPTVDLQAKRVEEGLLVARGGPTGITASKEGVYRELDKEHWKSA